MSIYITFLTTKLQKKKKSYLNPLKKESGNSLFVYARVRLRTTSLSHTFA